MPANFVETIFPPDAPTPEGHYSPGTAWGDLLFISGQLPRAADGSHNPYLPFEEQARQALRNFLQVLKEAGSSPGKTLKVTVYVVGIEHWPLFDQVFAEIFGDALPARAVVPVVELHHGYLVEIDGVAARCPSPRGAD